MTFLAGVAGVCAALLSARWLDERLNKPGTTYRRVMTWLLGPDEDDAPLAPVVPLPRSNVRAHCPFCGSTFPLHMEGCSPLDRLDAPRPKETRP